MSEIWDKKKSFVYTLSKDAAQNGFFNHTHNAYELYMFLRGETEYVIEGVAYELKPRSFVFVRAMDYHYVHLKSGGVYERAVIHFEPNSGYDDIAAAFSHSFVLNPDETDGIYAVLMKLLKASKVYDEEDAKTLLRSAVADILLQLKYLDFDVRQNRVPNETAYRASEYINANISEPLTVTSVAQKLYVSPSYLSHTFKKFFKTGVMQYIREKKIRRAAALIAAGTAPTEAYLQCGFKNYSTFYRLYKKINGFIPSDETLL